MGLLVGPHFQISAVVTAQLNCHAANVTFIVANPEKTVATAGRVQFFKWSISATAGTIAASRRPSFMEGKGEFVTTRIARELQSLKLVFCSKPGFTLSAGAGVIESTLHVYLNAVVSPSKPASIDAMGTFTVKYNLNIAISLEMNIDPVNLLNLTPFAQGATAAGISIQFVKVDTCTCGSRNANRLQQKSCNDQSLHLCIVSLTDRSAKSAQNYCPVQPH